MRADGGRIRTRRGGSSSGSPERDTTGITPQWPPPEAVDQALLRSAHLRREPVKSRGKFGRRHLLSDDRPRLTTQELGRRDTASTRQPREIAAQPELLRRQQRT
jgi:hypothetical protein